MPVAAAAPRSAGDGRAGIEAAVAALGLELVEIERGPRGLLRVTIDRIPGRAYADGGEFVTLDDCEAVTRQLQYALEVDAVPYERLEVSSPGLDRPLVTEQHYERFAGQAVSLVLKQPLNGRRAFKGVLGRGDGGWTLQFDDGHGAQLLGFVLNEVREARLVPVLDFKGRRGASRGHEAETAPGQAPAAPQDGDRK